MADAVRAAIPVVFPGSGAIPGGGVYELWKVFDAEPVASTGVKDSIISPTVFGFRLGDHHWFGLWISATSVSGTAAVQIDLLESYDDTAANYASPATGGTVAASHAETTLVYNLTPAPMGFMRIRLTGVGANPSDTIVSAYLFMQT